jgi:uncharacterized protein (DUF2267 family)
MTTAEPSIIGRSTEQAHIWFNDVAEQIGDQDRVYACRALRAVLHSLRDRLTVDVAANFAAQLPTLIRGIYYEDWDPSRTPLPIHDLDAFLEHVAREGRMAGETEASVAVSAVARVLRAHVSSGVLEDVSAVLPDGFRVLIEA